MRQKILVTGASGLLGTELCLQLSTLGVEVWAVDNHSRSSSIPVCDKFIKCDVSDPNQYYHFDFDFDYIFHYAAVNGTTNFYSNPNKVLYNNTMGDLLMFEFAKKCKNLKKLIYASSSEIVSDDITPTAEVSNSSIDDIHNPRWSYRLSKMSAENYLSNSDLPYLIIRYFNVYGNETFPGHFVFDQITKIKKGIFELIGAYETRSFCHVSDAIKVTICAIPSFPTNEIVNIGSDEEILIIDAANALASMLGHNCPNWRLLDGMEGSTKTRRPDLYKLLRAVPSYKPMKFIDGIKLLSC